MDSHGAGAITQISLDCRRFTQIGQNWRHHFFRHPWIRDEHWSRPESIRIVRIRLDGAVRKNTQRQIIFDGSVTHYFALYDKISVLELEQRIDYTWSDRKWTIQYGFPLVADNEKDAPDLMLVPVEGRKRQVPRVNGPGYLEHRPEERWMAVIDSVDQSSCALFYGRMAKIRENLRQVDYAPRHQLTPSIETEDYGAVMTLTYRNRVMQTRDTIDRRFRLLGLTEANADAISVQTTLWNDDLVREAEVLVESREKGEHARGGGGVESTACSYGGNPTMQSSHCDCSKSR